MRRGGEEIVNKQNQSFIKSYLSTGDSSTSLSNDCHNDDVLESLAELSNFLGSPSRPTKHPNIHHKSRIDSVTADHHDDGSMLPNAASLVTFFESDNDFLGSVFDEC